MIELDHISTLPPKKVDKANTKKALKKLRMDLFQLQNKFYANGRYSMLIILQGLDTSGKDGTIRHAFSGMNPQGVQVKSFKKPTADEIKHDFLWRVYPHFPEKGMINLPWHIIPADKRWYRNYSVAKILNGQLEQLKLEYPKRDKIDRHGK